MRKHLYQLALVVALSATFAFAQSTYGGANPSSSTPKAGASQSQSTTGDMNHEKDNAKKAGAVDNDTIRRQVKEQLATNPSFAGVNVEVSGGDAVTLTGDVPTKDDRTQAKNLAQAVPGVKKVRDHLKVNASAANSVGAMNTTGTTSNQAAAPSTAGSIAGNTEAQAGVASGSAATGANPSGSASQSASASQQQQTTTSSTTAIPQSDVTGSQSTTQQTGQTGAQPATSMSGTSAASTGSTAQVQQIQQVFQQSNISNVQVVNNNNTIQLVGTVNSQEEKDKAEQLAKQAAPGLTIQNNIQVSQSANTSTMNPPSASSSTSSSTGTMPAPSTSNPSAATQPPMGEASQQAAQTSSQTGSQTSASSTATQPPSGSVSAQSSTTTVPQSDVSAQSSTSTTGQTSTSTMPQSSNTGTATAGQAGDTAGMQSQIENAIKSDTSLSSCSTQVNVTETQIELTGTCPTGKEKQSARRVAQSFAGNRKVVDHIKVTGRGHEGMGTMGTGTGAGTSTSPSSGTNPPTSSGTTPPSGSSQPPMF